MSVLQPGLHGAFMADGFGQLPGPRSFEKPTGLLAGLRLAVKDVFDVAGLRVGAGNPAWQAGAAVASGSAPAVRMLLDAGASWAGKTVTDELTYSLAGINAHYGTPVNPKAADRIPGGSSSGSAVAVAAAHADIALGTDCGGSVRLPASYCGVWGMRPSHGRIASNGCFALAHSFDTVGWFARDGLSLAQVFSVLTHCAIDPVASLRFLAPPELLNALDATVRSRFIGALGLLKQHFEVSENSAPELTAEVWATAFRTLQAAEVWQQHGEWFDANGTALGNDVRQRFLAARQIGVAQSSAAQVVRVQATATMARLLERAGSLLLTPTVPTVAPLLNDAAQRIDDIRARSQQLLCMAGLAGLPQASIPWTEIDGAPLGLSVIGRRGDDETVLAAASAIGFALLHC